jgi:hypothetical protein
MLCDTLENQEQPSSCSAADPRKHMSAQAVAAQPPPAAAGTAKPVTTSAPNAANSANQIQQWQQILRVNIAAILGNIITRHFLTSSLRHPKRLYLNANVLIFKHSCF